MGIAVKQGGVLNVTDAYKHPNFSPLMDKETGYRTRGAPIA